MNGFLLLGLVLILDSICATPIRFKRQTNNLRNRPQQPEHLPLPQPKFRAEATGNVPLDEKVHPVESFLDDDSDEGDDVNSDTDDSFGDGFDNSLDGDNDYDGNDDYGDGYYIDGDGLDDSVWDSLDSDDNSDSGDSFDASTSSQNGFGGLSPPLPVPILLPNSGGFPLPPPPPSAALHNEFNIDQKAGGSGHIDIKNKN